MFGDNDNIADEAVKEDVVDLLAKCTKQAADNNPIMRWMLIELIRDLADGDEDTIANDNSNRKRALH